VGAYIPNSTEDLKQRLEGKAESLQGMVTGDQDKQTQGNIKDAKANAHDTLNKVVEGNKH
jgi:uncharacterized protein YjbJ (UPF0337 family)